jgi:hypothetical protein
MPQCRMPAPAAGHVEHIPDQFALADETGDERVFVARVEVPGVAGEQLLDFKSVGDGQFESHGVSPRAGAQVTA